MNATQAVAKQASACNKIDYGGPVIAIKIVSNSCPQAGHSMLTTCDEM